MRIEFSKIAQSLLLWASLFSSHAATLRWDANPEPDVAFYTVYAESSGGTNVFAVQDGTALVLDGLLPAGSYTLYVTATSNAGLESARSQGLTHTVGAIAAPLITAQPGDTVKATGDTISLSVSATGSGALTFEWRKDGQVLAGKTSASLVISNASVADGGLYMAVVSNAGGSVTSNPARVEVQVPPSIQAQPQSVAAPLGAGAVLSVNAGGSSLQYQWRKNSVAISGQTNSTLAISEAAATDAGNYRVVVSNLVGSTTSAVAAITIIYPPTIVTAPASTNLATGGTIQLGVSVNGTAPFTFEWLKNGAAIPSATGSTLTIGNAVVSDSGSYQVRVSNAAGSVTSGAATVSIQQDAPGIVAQPQSAAVVQGQQIALSVTATGTELSYQWLKNDLEISSAVSATFVVASFSVGDVGSYRVRVSNAGGFVLSDLASLTLISPVSIVESPISTNVATGGTIQLGVGVSGTGPFTYEWLKNGELIPNANGATLVIPNSMVTDSGLYQVRVSNGAGNVTSGAATVAVLEQPSIVAQPSSKDVLDGSLLELNVSANGSGVLAYQWFRNSAALAGSTGEVFRVLSASAANAGEYTVLVSNAVGAAQSEVATVRVLPRITITQQPASTNLQVGGRLDLAVQATGPSPLSYQWYRGAQSLSGATNAQFSIVQVSSGDAGSYTVRISSSLETVTSATALVGILQEPPSIVTQPLSAAVGQGRQLSLSVTATGTALTYQWLKNDVAIPAAVNATFTIASFTATDAGSYRVRVSNSFGSVLSEAAIISISVPPSVLEVPASTNVAVGGTIELAVAVTGTAPFTFEWLRNGVAVTNATNISLTIPAATTNHAGFYQVRVTNSAGYAVSGAASVVVIEPPKIGAQPNGGTIVEGARFVTTVAVSSTVPVTYRWLKNGVEISGTTSSTFEIAAVRLTDAGSYSVSVSNMAGAVLSGAALLQVSPAITILEPPTGTNVTSGESVNLKVKAGGPGAMSYQWYRDGVKLNGKTGSELIIANATLADAGTYTVEIISDGQRVMSPSVQVTVSDIQAASLTLSTASDGALRVTGVAPANTNYELQRTDSLSPANWRRIQNVSTRSDGRFEVLVPVSSSGAGFIRTVRR
ncbi:MAG TPA: immunoglobulin domain-containing protein [Verrucomicrobiae bacterium]